MKSRKLRQSEDMKNKFQLKTLLLRILPKRNKQKKKNNLQTLPENDPSLIGPSYRVWLGDTQLCRAITGGYWASAAWLVAENKVDVNETNIQLNDTPLHLAANAGHVDMVKLLLEHGANPTLSNKEGMTAVDVAIKKGYTNITLFLLDHGGAFNIPLSKIKDRHVQIEVEKWLVSRGTKFPNPRDEIIQQYYAESDSEEGDSSD